jgi:copper chaperone CopZ
MEQHYTETVFLGIDGMNCGNCANRVRNSLLATYGVSFVTIDQLQGMAEVQYNPTLASGAALLDAVASAGKDGFHHYSARIIP